MPRIKPAKFVHVVYRTRRFEAMVRWYQTVFDAKLQFKNPVLAFLTYDDEHHRFAFVNLEALQPDGPEKDKQGIIGVDHVAYTYASLNDLLQNYVQLKAVGIVPYWCIHHGVTVSMYYGDPDGNQMEFQVDSFATNEAANAYMAGPHYSTRVWILAASKTSVSNSTRMPGSRNCARTCRRRRFSSDGPMSRYRRSAAPVRRCFSGWRDKA